MATFTIDSIEGNSNIGVPVFSRTGRHSNYNYLVFSQTKASRMGESSFNQDKYKDNPKII